MKKQWALEQLAEGSASGAARAVGVTYQAVYQWPDPLPPRIADRVLAALARRRDAELSARAAEGAAAAEGSAGQAASA